MPAGSRLWRRSWTDQRIKQLKEKSEQSEITRKIDLVTVSQGRKDNKMTTASVDKMDPKGKLSWLERISYGLGDYGCNLVYSAISAFLLVYYTECVGMKAGVAASVMAVSKFFDGISDLIMGRIVDRTHTKWGKARPWIIRAAIPLAICNVLMYSMPENLGGGMQTAYAFITYNLVSTVFYTMLNVPYASLQGLMTVNQYERGILGNIRMLLATFGTMTVNTVVPILTGAFGGNSSRHAWTMTMIILMIVFILINCMTFFFCRERVVDETAQQKNETDPAKKKEPSVWACLKSLFVNRYWVLMIIFLFALYFMMSTFFGGNYYFAQYVLDAESSYSLLANALSIAQMAIMFVTPILMLKMKKRVIGIVGMATSGLGFILTAMAGKNVTIVVVANVIKGIGFGCSGAVMWGMLQDAITYGQWLTGVQAIGMGNSASSFTMKIGSGLGTAALGWILGAGNFDKNPGGAASIAAINTSVIWIPLIVCVISIICMVLFDLDKKYDAAVADLENGRWKGGSL
jgi:GPH family glycoside/pentoside/hexuronide:cation symporter